MTTAKITIEIEVTCDVDGDGYIIVDRIEGNVWSHARGHHTVLLATEPQISGALNDAIIRQYGDLIIDAVVSDDPDADRADYLRDMQRDDDLMGVR
jgi:HD superfamily phosphohydrolase